MRIEMPPRRTHAGTIIPMINVVFLLLIFFLLTAQVAPPEPFAISPPDGKADAPAGQRDVLYVSDAGEIAYDTARDEAVWSLIAARNLESPLEIRADAAAPAPLIAAMLQRLRGLGVTEAQLVVSGG